MGLCYLSSKVYNSYVEIMGMLWILNEVGKRTVVGHLFIICDLAIITEGTG